MQNDQSAHHDRVGWGIISTANIAVQAVAPAIQASANGRLVAVGSRNSRRVAQLYSFAPDIRTYDSYEGIINDPEIKAVYIPLPNSLHAEWTVKALQAGKHVLCEKPFCVTVDEGVKMVETARAQKLQLMEAFMYRFHPQIIWTLEQIRAGLIGIVRLVRISFSFDIRSRPEDIRLNPELAGGSLMDVGCYAVDLCRAIYRQSPAIVAARVHVPKPAGVEMATNAILDFGDGRFALLDTSFELPMRQMVEIIGEEGSITIPFPFTPGKRETVVFLMKNGQMTEQNFPAVDLYQLEVEHFVDCIRSNQARSLSEILENTATLEAIYQAAGHDWPIV